MTTPTLDAAARPRSLPVPSRATLAAGAALVPVGFAILGGVPALASPLGVMAAPGLALAALAAWLGRRWLALAAALLALAAPVMVLVVIFGGATLVNPLSAAEFVGSHLALAGGLVALVAGIHATVSGGGRVIGRAPALGAIALAALLAGGAATSALAEGRAVATGSGGGFDIVPDAVIEMEVRDFRFTPDPVEVRAGSLVEIRVTNADRAWHTLTYDNGGRTYDHELLPGATTSFVARFTEAGEIELWCRPHATDDGHGGHSGMVGRLVVRE